MIRRLLAAGSIAASLAACAGPTTTVAPSAAPVIVTFEVADERFQVLLTDPADVENARKLLAGDDAPAIPDGRIVPSTGVNTGYSWSLDPNDIRFTDETDADCDGSPSDVESGQLASSRYCPSAADVVAIDPLPPEATPSPPSGS